MVVRAADGLGDNPGLPNAATPDGTSVDGSALVAIVRGRLFEDAEPARIGRFVVVERIAAGGMGVVYAGYDPQLERPVAIKLLLAAGAGEIEHRRLVREAQAMAKLADPNVAHVYEVGTHHGHTFVAMEHVRGQTLRAWLGAHARDLREVLAVMLQAGRGLVAAHAAGVVHRDFKPDNVMVGDDGRVRVVDFGLARHCEADPSDPSVSLGDTDDDLARVRSLDTRDGVVVGTPAYMAPEQHEGATAEATADQFAFCVTCWEAVTGVRPYAAASLTGLREAMAQGRIAAAPASVMPGWIEAVLRRGLATAASARYPSMHALLGALERDPTVRRRRWALGAAIVAAGAGVWGYGVLAERNHARACVEEGAAIASVWNDEIADRVAAAFVDTGRVDAPAALARAQPRLDAFVDAWSRTRGEACLVATREDPGPLEQAHACLDEQRHHLSALVDQLHRPDAVIVQHAVTAAAALPVPQTCVDPRSLPRRALLVEPMTASQRAELARITVLRSTGRYDEAFAALATLADQAQTRQPGIELARGLIEEARGHYEPAREALEQAFYGAGEAGDDSTALRAATGLVSVVGYRLARTDPGLGWHRIAQMFASRLELADDPDTAMLESHLGLLYDAAGRYPEALAAHHRALAIRESVLGDAHPETAASWFNVGAVAAELGRFDEALSAYDRALAIDEAALGAEHPNLGSTLNSKGMLLSQRGDYDNSMLTLQRALAIKRNALGEAHPSMGNTLVALGNLDARFGRKHEALEKYQRALAIFEQALGPEHPSVAAVLVSTGNALSNLERMTEARAAYERALHLQEKRLGPDHADLAVSLYNLAALIGEAGDLDAALRMFERCDRIMVASLGAQSPDRPAVLTAIATIELAQGHRARAIETLERALELRTQLGAAADDLADTQFMLAKALGEEPGQRARAWVLAQAAREAWRQLGPDRAATVAEVDAWLATVRAPAAPR